MLSSVVGDGVGLGSVKSGKVKIDFFVVVVTVVVVVVVVVVAADEHKFCEQVPNSVPAGTLPL